MRLITVGKKEIKGFVDFPDQLYKDDPNYVPYMKASLRKTLYKLIIIEKTYHALMILSDEGEILGRVLFTIETNRQLHTDKCGFFSLYECVEDFAVSDFLLAGMVNMMRKMDAEYVSGTYFPADPDNRRGFLVKGFDRQPVIFTSYNPPYYNDQMEHFGMKKQIDSLQYRLNIAENQEYYARLSAMVLRRQKLHLDHLNRSNLERDIIDVQKVLESANTELNYQGAPTMEEMRRIFTSWQRFLLDDLIVIARRDSDNSPVGFGIAIPDFYQLFKAANGKMDLRGIWIMTMHRNKINAARAIMQYAIPEYRKRGIFAVGYSALQQAFLNHGMEYVEAGTIMENNTDSFSVLEHVGGELSRVYRIYYKDLREETDA